MFLSFHKTIAKFGGFRLGLGIRANKKNSFLIYLLIMCVSVLQLTWYMMLLTGWIVYATCYGIYWCIKKLVKACSKKSNAER